MNSFGKKLFIPFFFLIISFLTVKCWPDKKIEHPPGVLVDRIPIQKKLKEEKFFIVDDYVITAKASFDVKARVLSTEDYGNDRESDLSPIDFALGWGPMSDQKNLDKINISQRRRWFYWKSKSLPISQRAIEVNSANMHILPANDKIEDKLDDVYEGSIVEIRGYLVNIKAGDGWRWKSSMSREDTGNGACEVFWVEDINVIN